MTIRKIGVLTGGGDVPGLNPCIKAVTRCAIERGWEVVGIRRGYGGLLDYDPDDATSGATHLTRLDLDSVRTIDRTGGTVLHTTRTSPDRIREAHLPAFLKGKFAADAAGHVDCTPHILRVLEALRIDALIALGGDGTLSYSARLGREGVTMMSVPKTMDNDVFGTDYCIGFSTAVSRSVEFISALRTTAGSHERIAVIELFGRNSGETALITGFLADVDRVLIAEVPFEIAEVSRLLVEDRDANPARYAMLVVSEGAMMQGGEMRERGPRDAYGTQKPGGIGEILGNEIHRLTGAGTIVQNLGYLMRAGAPDALDLMVAKSYGAMAVQLLADGRRNLMMTIQDGKYAAMPGDICLQGKRRVDTAALYDSTAYRPRIGGVPGKPMFLY